MLNVNFLKKDVIGFSVAAVVGRLLTPIIVSITDLYYMNHVVMHAIL